MIVKLRSRLASHTRNPVIACAKRIPNAVVMRGPAASHHIAMDTVEEQLDSIACERAVFIEQQGGLAIPVTADGSYYDWDRVEPTAFSH